MSDLYFEIMSGPMLERVKQRIADYSALLERNEEVIKAVGADRYWHGLMDGSVCGVANPKDRTQFTKPKANGFCTPKKGSEAAEIFKSQKGLDDWRGYRLAEELGVPTTIKYTFDGGYGSGSIVSRSFNSGVGFLYLSADGPYALYIPNVPEVVAKYEAEGKVVDDACKNFKPEFDGCRPILKEEWDFMVAKHDMEEAKKKLA